MTAIVTSNFRSVNAENFKQDVADEATSVYVGIGKADAWSNSLSDTTDTTPFTPVDALDATGEAFQNMIGMKKVGESDISHVVPRHTWENAETYVPWDSDDGSIFDKKFYIITSEFKVYKAIKAGGAGSTVEPTQTMTEPQLETADGYVWKYMYTLAVIDAEKFLTNSYMPVITIDSKAGGQTSEYNNDQLAMDDLSEAYYAQYLNQKASLNSSTAAGIERIEVTNGGTYSATPVVTISGDGTGAAAIAVMSGSGSTQTVASITVDAKGTDYTVADITFSTGDAAARAVIAPVRGHGTDPVTELGGFFIALNTQLTGAEDGDLTVGNDFRQVTIVRNPFNYGTAVVATAITRKTLRYLDFVSGVTVTNFDVDEVITGATSGAEAFVVERDATSGYLYYNQNSKTGYKSFEDNETVTGATTSTSGVLESSGALGNPEVEPGSGAIMFLENRNPINRTATQIEDIKVIIEF